MAPGRGDHPGYGHGACPGPESLFLDDNFPNHGHVYGIRWYPTTRRPSGSSDNQRQGAVCSDPYRLYNGGIFEFPASVKSIAA